MDVDAPLDPQPNRRVADKDTKTKPFSAPDRGPSSLPGTLQRDPDAMQGDTGPSSRPAALENATSNRVNRTSGSFVGRDLSLTWADGSQAAGYSPSIKQARDDESRHNQTPQQQTQRQPPSSSNSQDTGSTTDPVFTPPASEGGMSSAHANGHESSQESQLLQLSQLAAAQERIPDSDVTMGGTAALSKKRMADGMVKHSRDRSSVSPVRVGGHSRNTSAVSVASTTGSRIGEVGFFCAPAFPSTTACWKSALGGADCDSTQLSAELKARLSYAMVKVNNGWQSHTIEQVESLASHAASPTSSSSTIHLRNGASASPQLSSASHRASHNSTPSSGPYSQFPGRGAEAAWRGSPQSHSHGSPTSPVKPVSALAPPVSIQPGSRPMANSRRNSNPRHTPTLLGSSNHASPSTAPHTPGQPSPYIGTTHQRTPMADPILFSPHQNVREQDAIESLLFMSSPGNSANLKHAFPASSSQPVLGARPGSQRTALPSSQPRKSLPSGRPSQHSHSHSQSNSQPQKRVGFEKSPSEMDVDEPFGTPTARATPKRKVNGHGHGTPQRLKQLPLSSGLTAPSRPRPALADEDIERMLDRVAADDSSDSDGEIQIPVARGQRAIGA